MTGHAVRSKSWNSGSRCRAGRSVTPAEALLDRVDDRGRQVELVEDAVVDGAHDRAVVGGGIAAVLVEAGRIDAVVDRVGLEHPQHQVGAVHGAGVDQRGVGVGHLQRRGQHVALADGQVDAVAGVPVAGDAVGLLLGRQRLEELALPGRVGDDAGQLAGQLDAGLGCRSRSPGPRPGCRRRARRGRSRTRRRSGRSTRRSTP